MEHKPESSLSSWKLQCVGRLEITRPKPAGFLCGSIPVTTDKILEFSSDALLPSPHTIKAPRYQMIPTETDLNALPSLSSIPDKVLPISAAHSRTRNDSSWKGGHIMPSLARKGEALAVSGLAEHGDEIDIISPADILKQIFKIPYSKARVSIVVHRVGQTLILNTGPDIEEGEKLIQRHSRQPKCVDQSLFLNFARHSARMEACDCPPSHNTSSDKSSIYPRQFVSNNGSLQSVDHLNRRHASVSCSDCVRGKEFSSECMFHSDEKEKLFQEYKKNKSRNSCDSIHKVADMKENPWCPVQESEQYIRVGDDEFLKVLFWKFHNFRMLLGSDLLIFSNEKYVAVSLHLWDVSSKVTPLNWLEAWLDNFMASVPELAICYHKDGVVQGYELLKTDDIFLLKGISDDGTPAFQPHVIQQNGLSVLKFLEENCKQDPGAYWLCKSAEEDVIQLFDLSVIPQNHTADGFHDSSGALPSLIHRGRSDSILSLGTLLYRIAHRLSLSMSPDNKARCAGFFKQCLDVLDEPNHFIVRALAHEQFARLLLTYDKDLELSCEELPMEPEVTIIDTGDVEFINGSHASGVQDILQTTAVLGQPDNEGNFQNIDGENAVEISQGQKKFQSEMPAASDLSLEDGTSSGIVFNDFAASNLAKTSSDGVDTVADLLSSKLAAIHHVSQAIKSLRWTRELQKTRPNIYHESESDDDLASSVNFSVCACGDSDCIEVCDIRHWLLTSKIDNKLLKLVLLLGESYLALGQAYKDAGQLYQTLKVVELACLIYGSMPQESRFISSMFSSSSAQAKMNVGNKESESSMRDMCLTFDSLPYNYLFWANAWILVGDVFIEFYLVKGQQLSTCTERKQSTRDLKMPSEVWKEVERLNKKMAQYNKNCNACFLMNCSCQSDRASSGSSASSSARDAGASARKQSKRTFGRSILPYSRGGSCGDDVFHKGDHMNTLKVENLKPPKINARKKTCKNSDSVQEMNLGVAGSERGNDSMETNHAESGGDKSSKAFSKGGTPSKIGGIFKYLKGSISGDADYMLSVSLNCYEEARKAFNGLPAISSLLQSVVKKKGWVCNELGRIRLERKDLRNAETAFVEAISAFKHVEDHINIILIYCNLGHGHRALAEDMVSNINDLKQEDRLGSATSQLLDTAKLQYSEALGFYLAAKTELTTLSAKSCSLFTNLKNEVSTQLAHTYLKLGMLLARENTLAKTFENCVREDYTGSNFSRVQKDVQENEMSANDAIREALSLYESLGESRKQEASYAYYQLACYQRDCCFRFMDSNNKTSFANGDSCVILKVKQYASLAERNWQKSMDFYGPKTHPVMYLNILIDMSSLSVILSSYLHSTALLESALTHLFEGRHLSGHKSLNDENREICTKFWSKLQTLLKSMLAATRTTKGNKNHGAQQSLSSKTSEAKKLSKLYLMSLKSSDFHQLQIMHNLWLS